MLKSFKFIVFTLIFLLAFSSFTLLADNTVSLESKSPESATKKLIQEKDRAGMRGVLYSQIPDTISANAYACQLDPAYPLDADMCDDITPDGTGWRIDSVTTWWWNWTGFQSYDSVPNFHFMVYRDSAAASPHPVDSPFIDIIVPQTHYTATAFDTISHKYRVDMELPVSVELPADTMYWIEVQPTAFFNFNGQTGWLSQPGCGNGTGFFHRFPAVAINEWVSAEVQHGDSQEVAIVLRGGYISGIPEVIEGSLTLSVDQLTTSAEALISYSVSKRGPATLKIYDIIGKKVKTLVNIDNETPGVKNVSWDYKNDNGTSVVNGVYLIRLESDDKTATQKLILAR